MIRCRNSLPAIVLLCVFPVLSAAACPELEDLKQGIRVNFDDGTNVTYFAVEDNRREMFVDPENSIKTLLTTQHGVFQTFYFDLSDGLSGIRETYTYSFDPSSVFPLQPNSNKKGTISIVSNDTSGMETHPYTYEVGAMSDVEIGDCTYPMMQLTETTTYDNGESVVILGYVPSLGISLFLGETGPDYGPDYYNPVQIFALDEATE